jgi:hypothetical protein
MIPGVVIMNKWIFMNGLLLLFHVLVLVIVENTLVLEPGTVRKHGSQYFSEFYPPYIVLFTSLFGTYVTLR